MTKQQIDWMEFKDKMIELGEIEIGRNCYIVSDHFMGEKLPAFISSLPISHLSEVKEEVEGMKKEEFDFELPEDMEFGRERVMDMRSGHNEAIDLVSHLLSEKISKIK